MANPTPDAAREAVTRCGDVRANTPCTREAGHDGPHWHEKHGTRSRILWHDDTRDLRAKLAAAEARAARLEEALREIAEDYCMCEDEDGYSLGQCAVCKAEDALDAARAAGGADHG